LFANTKLFFAEQHNNNKMPPTLPPAPHVALAKATILLRSLNLLVNKSNNSDNASEEEEKLAKRKLAEDLILSVGGESLEEVKIRFDGWIEVVGSDENEDEDDDVEAEDSKPSSNVFASFTQNSPNLQSLSVDLSLFQTILDFDALLEGATLLTSLTLYGSSFLVPRVLMLISNKQIGDPDARRCDNLESLKFISPAGQKNNDDNNSTHADSNSSLLKDEIDCITFVSDNLQNLWIDSCNNLEGLILQTPNLHRLHVSSCSALHTLRFSNEDDLNIATHLRNLHLSDNASMSTRCISTMVLPSLQKLQLLGFGISDVQFGDLIKTAAHSIASMRLLDCRLLGDIRSWAFANGFCNIGVLSLKRPSATSFQFDSISVRGERANRSNTRRGNHTE